MENLVLSEKFIAFCENEITQNILSLTDKYTEEEALEVAKELVKRIPWDNIYLMHKGLHYISERYLIRRGIL